MLEEKDLQAIQSLLQNNNKIIKNDTIKSIVESEKLMLDELDRMKGFINGKSKHLKTICRN